MPFLSVLLCTVRDKAYLEHPEWGNLEKICEMLEAQTFKDFELIVVDGLHSNAPSQYPEHHGALRGHDMHEYMAARPFPVVHVAPRPSFWQKRGAVAISCYRNTGLALARGQLVVNLDDACVLPPVYLEVFAKAWRDHGIAVAATWPRQGDQRQPGLVTMPGRVFGFGSYPLELARRLNGYDEAYDGGQGLEDIDWSTRLWEAGLRQGLADIPGFNILPQTAHDTRAVRGPAVQRCCNASWQTQRVTMPVHVANREWSRERREALVGPCQYLAPDNTCRHHGLECAWLKLGWPFERSPAQQEFVGAPLDELVVDVSSKLW